MENNLYRKLFNFEYFCDALILYSYQRFEKDFENMKDVKYRSSSEIGTSYKKRNSFHR